MRPLQASDKDQAWLPARLLWIDGSAGALVGILSLLLAHSLSAWYRIDLNWIYAIGVANILYGAYALRLASATPRRRVAVNFLIFANMAWACVCLVLLNRLWDSASFLGLGHLILESLFVTALAVTEWRHRATLSS